MANGGFDMRRSKKDAKGVEWIKSSLCLELMMRSDLEQGNRCSKDVSAFNERAPERMEEWGNSLDVMASDLEVIREKDIFMQSTSHKASHREPNIKLATQSHCIAVYERRNLSFNLLQILPPPVEIQPTITEKINADLKHSSYRENGAERHVKPPHVKTKPFGLTVPQP